MPNKTQIVEGEIREIEEKIKQKEAIIASGQKNFEKVDAECKSVATEKQKLEDEVKDAERSVKAAGKDKKALAEAKKKLTEAEKKLDACCKKGMELHKKREMIEAAPEKAKENIVGLKKDLELAKKKLVQAKKEVETGIVAYGKARSDYLDWFRGQEAKLNKMLKEADGYATDAKKALEDTEKAVDQGNAGPANTFALAAQTAADKAGQIFESVGTTIQEWHGVWTKQRNLNVADYGLEAADVKVHAGVTAKVYETFKIGDEGRDHAKEAATAAAQAAAEAKALASVGAKNLVYYKGVVERAKKGQTTLIEHYNYTTSTLWGKVIAEEGGSLKKILTLVKSDREKGLASALKAVEQGRQILPKTVSNARKEMKAIGDFLVNELKKIPEEFRRPLKSDTDKMRMDVLKIVQHLKAYDGKYETTMKVLQELEDATK